MLSDNTLILLNHETYHFAIDVWGAGLTLAQHVFPDVQQFRYDPKKHASEIDFVAQLVGSEALALTMQRFEMLNVGDDVVAALQANYPKFDLKTLTDTNKLASPELIQVLEKALSPDMHDRATAEELSKLPYFAKK